MSIFDNLGEAQAKSNALGDDSNREKKKFEKILYYNPVLNKDGEPLPLFKPKMGMNMFDILPWIAESDLFGMKGLPVFDVTVDVNMKVGSKMAQMVSRSGLGYSNDPIQEEQFRLYQLAKDTEGLSKSSSKEDKKKSKNWSTATSLFAMKRSMYIINVYNEDGTKTPHLFTPAYNSFAKFLVEKEEFLKSTGQAVPLWGHPTQGPTICLTGVSDPFPGNDGKMVPFIGFNSVETVPRAKPYLKPDATEEEELAFIKRIPSLDSYLKIPTEEEVYTMLFGVAPSQAPMVAETPAPVVEEEAGLSFSSAAPTLNVPDNKPVAEPAPEPSFEDDIPF